MFTLKRKAALFFSGCLGEKRLYFKQMQIQSSDHRGQPMHDKAWKGLDVRKSCEQNFGRIPRASENTRNGKRWPDFFFFFPPSLPILTVLLKHCQAVNK